MARVIALDCETTGLRLWHGDSPFMVSSCDNEGSQRVWEWPVNPFTRKVEYDRAGVRSLRKVVEDPRTVKVFHNAKFDLRALEEGMGLVVQGPVEDTMFAAHVAYNLEPSYGLKKLGQRYLRVEEDDEQALKRAVLAARRQGKKLGWKLGTQSEADYWMPKVLDSSSRVCETYCKRDSERTILLWIKYQQQLTQDQLWKMYEQELELLPYVYAMERKGVCLNLPLLNYEVQRHQEERAESLERMKQLVDHEFNPRSTSQVAAVVYDERKLPGTTRSVDKAVLSSLKLDPFVQELIQFRMADKALGSFFSNYLKNSRKETSGLQIIHATFNQVGPRTGRFSCAEPNLQNAANAITSHADRPLQVRGPLGPRPGYTWYHFDFSQLELRVFAGLAEEATMMAAVHSGRDIPSEVANRAWGGSTNPLALEAAAYALGVGSHSALMRVAAGGDSDAKTATWNSLPGASDKEKLTHWMESFNWDIVAAEGSLGSKTKRTQAKTILYCRLFGGGVKTLAGLLGVAHQEAAGFSAEFERAFPTMTEFMERTIYGARKAGYVINPYQRRLWVDSNLAYKAVNYLIQSTAADLMKRGFVRVARILERNGVDGFLVMTIHDELVVELRKGQDTWKLLNALRKTMEDTEGKLAIPITVEVEQTVERWDMKSKVELPRERPAP
jgi:DNA polymerase I